MYVCMYVCMYVFLYVHYAGFHLEKWTRGGKVILRESLGGGAVKGLCATASPLGDF